VPTATDVTLCVAAGGVERSVTSALALAVLAVVVAGLGAAGALASSVVEQGS
jgi:hypothetical protein